MKRVFQSLFILLTIALVGCQSDEESIKEKNVDPPNKQVIEAHNIFAFNLFQEISTLEDDEDVFISPTSALFALAMLYNGADGETKDEIATVLQAEDIDLETFNDASSKLLQALQQSPEDIVLDIANSLWINDQYIFQDDFQRNMKEGYEAMVESIDILDPQSIDQINDWISEATNGNIEKMIDSLKENTVAILLNAIYLDANWTIPFDPDLTEEKPFYVDDDEEIDVPMMILDEEIRYLETDDFQAAQLGYGDEEAMDLTILLPKEELTMEKLHETITIDNWNEWDDQFQKMDGTLILPRFSLEYEIVLNDYLDALGMPSVFQKDANLKRLIEESESLMVSEIKQKSMIKVDEEGTEASATTSVTVEETSAPLEDETFTMEVNRPFHIAITDRHTDALLFLGKIIHPRE